MRAPSGAASSRIRASSESNFSARPASEAASGVAAGGNRSPTSDGSGGDTCTSTRLPRATNRTSALGGAEPDAIAWASGRRISRSTVRFSGRAPNVSE